MDKFKSKKGRGAAAASSAKGGSASGGKTAAPAAEVTRGPLARDSAGLSHRILLKPIFTEKAQRLATVGKYAFFVAPDAGKVQIMEAIRDLYGVKPVSVRVVNVKGKMVRFGRTKGREKMARKALVSLKKGETLTVMAA